MPAVVVLVLTIASVSAGCAAAVNPQAIDDAQTAARVKTALVNDPELGGRPIEVRVAGGVAHLTGRVRSADEVARTIALARGVAGVQDVESRLQIGAEPTADPTPLPVTDRGAVEEELRELRAPPTLLALGVSVSRTHPREEALGPRVAVGPLIKLGAGRGVGPIVGFNWFHADLSAAESGRAVSRISIKPIMGGIGYTTGPDGVAITTAFVAGVAFNSLKVRSPGIGPLAVDVSNSFVWRPNVSVWRNLTRRTVLNLSVGYVGTRMRVTFLEDGAFIVRRMSGSTVVVSGGIAYRIF